MDQSVVGPGVPLADAQWARIEPLLPDRTPKRGGRWRDHREVIDTIAYIPHRHAVEFTRGLTTKIHLAADARCRPLAFVLTAGQAGDALAYTEVMVRLDVPPVLPVRGESRRGPTALDRRIDDANVLLTPSATGPIV
ncbi:hypothetical protein L4B83_01730 [Streptomyces sp. PSAA01]|nr:transposase [Streptomyces sp. PSAA01]MCG0283763.1 hypothetical protein [Streptomyces sp. PSAA01]